MTWIDVLIVDLPLGKHVIKIVEVEGKTQVYEFMHYDELSVFDWDEIRGRIVEIVEERERRKKLKESTDGLSRNRTDESESKSETRKPDVLQSPRRDGEDS